MSLRWSDAVCATLSPARVSLAAWPRGWAEAPAHRETLTCPPAPEAPRWAPAATRLHEALAALPARRGDVRFVLSNQFVRYLVLPWNPALTGRAEREAQAAHLLRETYGDLALRWVVKVSDAEYGRPALACAIDRDFLTALTGGLAGTGRRLASLQPLLMVIFNRFRSRLQGDACLLVLEHDGLCCAVIRGGQWQTVSSTRLGAAGWTDGLVERQIAVHGLAADTPRLLVDLAGLSGPAREGEPFTRLAWRAGTDAALDLFACPA